MKIKKQQVEQRMAHFKKVGRDEGIKLTHQRLEIFQEIAQTGDHPDAEQIFQRVRKRMTTISLDTVYRTLWLLNDLGLIITLGTSRERTRFDANLSRHHHFVCTRCGFTRDFYSDDLNNLRLPESVGAFGSIEATLVEVKGVCQECTKKGK
jgi:Fur family peroxide stress response transcriptional regulator